jgi:hypothetical protein
MIRFGARILLLRVDGVGRWVAVAVAASLRTHRQRLRLVGAALASEEAAVPRHDEQSSSMLSARTMSGSLSLFSCDLSHFNVVLRASALIYHRNKKSGGNVLLVCF